MTGSSLLLASLPHCLVHLWPVEWNSTHLPDAPLLHPVVSLVVKCCCLLHGI